MEQKTLKGTKIGDIVEVKYVDWKRQGIFNIPYEAAEKGAVVSVDVYGIILDIGENKKSYIPNDLIHEVKLMHKCEKSDNIMIGDIVTVLNVLIKGVQNPKAIVSNIYKTGEYEIILDDMTIKCNKEQIRRIDNRKFAPAKKDDSLIVEPIQLQCSLSSPENDIMQFKILKSRCKNTRLPMDQLFGYYSINNDNEIRNLKCLNNDDKLEISHNQDNTNLEKTVQENMESYFELDKLQCDLMNIRISIKEKMFQFEKDSKAYKALDDVQKNIKEKINSLL